MAEWRRGVGRRMARTKPPNPESGPPGHLFATPGGRRTQLAIWRFAAAPHGRSMTAVPRRACARKARTARGPTGGAPRHEAAASFPPAVPRATRAVTPALPPGRFARRIRILRHRQARERARLHLRGHHCDTWVISGIVTDVWVIQLAHPDQSLDAHTEGTTLRIRRGATPELHFEIHEWVERAR